MATARAYLNSIALQATEMRNWTNAELEKVGPQLRRIDDMMPSDKSALDDDKED